MTNTEEYTKELLKEVDAAINVAVSRYSKKMKCNCFIIGADILDVTPTSEGSIQIEWKISANLKKKKDIYINE